MPKNKKPQAGTKIVRQKDVDGNIIEYKYIEIKRTVGGRERSFTGKTRREAMRKYQVAKEKYITEQHTQRYQESNTTFEEWANKWLEVYKYGTVQAITYANSYESPTRNHLIPFFGAMKLRDVKQSDVQRFFQTKNSYSYSMQDKMLLCLRSIFNTAMGDRLINTNPAQNIKLGVTEAESRGSKDALSYEQARTVIDFAKGHPLGIDVIMLLKTGMRRSELVALPLKYNAATKGAYSPGSQLNGGIDLKNKIVHVRQSISEGNLGIEFGPCKNKQSMRDIPFDDELYELLKKEKDSFYLKRSDRTIQRDYFVSGRFGGYMRPTNWYRQYKRFCNDFDKYSDENNLGFYMVKPHECRLSFGSILYNRTKDIVTVSKLMGHANIEITARLYVDSNMDVFRNIVEKGL